MIDTPLFDLFAVCAAVLSLKMLVVGHYTGLTRMRRGVYLNPEDARAFPGEGRCTSAEHADVDRGLRAHRNDLESTLPFFGIGLVYVLMDPPVAVATSLLITFTAFRCVFSFFYIRGLQPWRSLSFTLAELCLLAMLVQILWWGLPRAIQV